MYIQDNKQS